MADRDRKSNIRASDVRRSIIDNVSIADIRQSFITPVEPFAETTSTSLVGNLTAAIALTVIEVVNCISIALILTGRWKGEIFDVLFKSVMMGFIMTQVATSAFTKFPAAVSSGAFENLAILSALRDVVRTTMEDVDQETQVVNFMACIAVSLLVSSILLATAAIPQVGKILALLPDDVRHGVFLALGIAIFMLGFDSFDLEPFSGDTWTDGMNLLKWIPAYCLGVGLWFVAERCPSRFLIIGFITIVVVTMWIILRICGLSTQEAAEGGWVLADVEPESIATFFSMTYGSLSKIDFSIIGSNMGSIVASAFVGPVMNVSINVVVLNGMLGPIKGISFGMEFLGQSLGSFLSCVTFGFSSYMTVADTGLMIKAGGRDAQPVLMMVAFMLIITFVPSILVFLAATIPRLLPAAIFVYLGVDIALGCLKEMQETLTPKERCFSLLVCFVCTWVSLPVGLGSASAMCVIAHYTTSVSDIQNPDIENMKVEPVLNSLQEIGQTRELQLSSFATRDEAA